MALRKKADPVRSHIVDAFRDAIELSHGIAMDVGKPDEHPIIIDIRSEDTIHSFQVYAWLLQRDVTQVGRQYGLEKPEIHPEFNFDHDGETLCLGYYPDLNIFIGFGPGDRENIDPALFSLPIPESFIHETLQEGLFFDTWDNQWGNDEIMVGVRPDLLLYYTTNFRKIHNAYSNLRLDDPAFNRWMRMTTPWEQMNNYSPEDMVVIKDVEEKVRCKKFQRKVLNAYEHRCAVTRMQLELVEAAHVFPFKYKGMEDDITNGIALSPTYHWAFDKGLIWLDHNYIMHINEGKVSRLVRVGLDAGLETIREHITGTDRIHLPSDEKQRPSEKMILLGIKARNIKKPRKKRRNN